MRIRNESGKFETNGEQQRQVRSIRLTDSTWEKLGQVAAARGVTRADVLESMVEDTYLLDYLKLGAAHLETIANSVMNDPAVTRKGKDTGSVKRAIVAFMARLRSKQQQR